MVNQCPSTIRRFIWPFAAWLFTWCFSGVSEAATTYYWTINGGGNWPTAVAACEAHIGGIDWLVYVRTQQGEVPQSAHCMARRTEGSTVGGWATADRRGDSCPEGSTYNPAIFGCEAPAPDPCESSIGQSLSHEHRMGEYTGGGAIGGRTDPPGVVCQNSCQYAWDSAGPANVYRFVDGTPNGVFGLFAYKGNGVSCSAEDAPTKGPSSLEAQSKSESSCTDKVTDGEGRVLMTCQTSSEYTNPGSCDRGQVNGETVCIPNSPSPSQQKTETEKDITEVTNPDGSKTTTTSETTTTTHCSGTKACTTSVTNNTSVSHTNADGSKGNESSTCTGAGCKDGDGKSQDDKAKEEEEQEEADSSASGLQCEQSIACEGDAIQCAILQQAKEQKCAAEELNDFSGHKQEIAELLAGADPGNPESPQIQVPSFIDAGARWLPSGTCSADKTVSLQSGGGKTLAFSYEPLCAAASDLSYVFVALAGIAAALYVGRAFGGA